MAHAWICQESLLVILLQIVLICSAQVSDISFCCSCSHPTGLHPNKLLILDYWPRLRI